MDLFTEQYARTQRAVLTQEIRRATALGPHVSAKHGRTRRWVQAGRWIQATIALLRAVSPTTRPQAPEQERRGRGHAADRARDR